MCSATYLLECLLRAGMRDVVAVEPATGGVAALAGVATRRNAPLRDPDHAMAQSAVVRHLDNRAAHLLPLPDQRFEHWAHAMANQISELDSLHGASALPPVAGLVGADPPPTPDWAERVHIV
jgi:hypothetical protein